MKKKYFIHPSSYVDDGALIGEGTRIWHFCHILGGAKVGRHCKIGQNVVIHASVVIGDHVKIQNNVSIYDGVTLEDDVFCGPSCVFTNILNPRSAVDRSNPVFFRPTLVSKGATIGANATILCGIKIGRYAFIGAGAVVTHDVPDHALVYGNPALQNGWICACGERIKVTRAGIKCTVCDAEYRKDKGRLTRSV